MCWRGVGGGGVELGWFDVRSLKLNAADSADS